MIKGLIIGQSGCKKAALDERIVHRKKLEINGGKKEMRGRKDTIVKQTGCNPEEETLLFRFFERSKEVNREEERENNV